MRHSCLSRWTHGSIVIPAITTRVWSSWPTSSSARPVCRPPLSISRTWRMMSRCASDQPTLPPRMRLERFHQATTLLPKPGSHIPTTPPHRRQPPTPLNRRALLHFLCPAPSASLPAPSPSPSKTRTRPFPECLRTRSTSSSPPRVFSLSLTTRRECAPHSSRAWPFVVCLGATRSQDRTSHAMQHHLLIEE